MNTAESIRVILADQINGYGTLLDLLRKERENLISVNSEGVEEISKEKDTVVLRLRLLEEERIRLIHKFVAENGISGDISLQRLGEITGEASFLDMRLQLISLVQGIAELNEFNRILIERSMNFVRNASRFLDNIGLNIRGLKTGSSISREA